MENFFGQAHSTRPTTQRTTDEENLHNLTIPTELIINHRDSPLAIGLYCLIVRLFIIHQKPLSISNTDITLYDPTISRESVNRALKRLIDDGWVERARQGNKIAYQPCWGRIRGDLRLWEFGKPLLNRPPHLDTTLFDKRMLDFYL